MSITRATSSPRVAAIVKIINQTIVAKQQPQSRLVGSSSFLPSAAAGAAVISTEGTMTASRDDDMSVMLTQYPKVSVPLTLNDNVDEYLDKLLHNLNDDITSSTHTGQAITKQYHDSGKRSFTSIHNPTTVNTIEVLNNTANEDNHTVTTLVRMRNELILLHKLLDILR